MIDEEKKEIARQIIRELIDGCNYSDIYEDEGLEYESEEVWKEIHGLVLTAKVEVRW